MENIVIILVLCLIASLVLILRLYRIIQADTAGTLIIATDETDGSDYIFLEISRMSLADLKKQDSVRLVVKNKTHD